MGGVSVKPYLRFVAMDDGTFRHNTSALEYSVDNGRSWVALPAQTNTPVVAAGTSIIWRGSMVPSNTNKSFSSSGRFSVSGNPLSLIYGNDFEGKSIMDYAFSQLFFGCVNLVSADGLVIPDDYNNRQYVCYAMFYGCTSLTSAPSLPAMTLATRCYQQMFQNCSSLMTAPSLPATTLAERCYENMFLNCSGLVDAPRILPATTLSSSCYSGMFGNCSSLVTAPELPAITLVDNCYKNMFFRCSKLNYIKAMFVTTPSASYTSNWVISVSATGTFVKNSAATWSVTGENGIPNNWTIETADS